MLFWAASTNTPEGYRGKLLSGAVFKDTHPDSFYWLHRSPTMWYCFSYCKMQYLQRYSVATVTGAIVHAVAADWEGSRMLRLTGKCCPNGSLFHKKSLDMGPILVKKILKGGFCFNKNCKKIVKSAGFSGRKTLRNGSQFAKISKKLSNQPFF